MLPPAVCDLCAYSRKFLENRTPKTYITIFETNKSKPNTCKHEEKCWYCIQTERKQMKLLLIHWEL